MKIENDFGTIEFDFKYDLNAEEGDDYIPSFYDGGVVELKMITAARKGVGHKLMLGMLTSDMVKSSKLVFLDCSPYFLDGKESDILQYLHDFYHGFGFRGKTSDGNSRLWLIREIPESDDQCFSGGFNPSNDLHCLLRSSIQSRDESLHSNGPGF